MMTTCAEWIMVKDTYRRTRTGTGADFTMRFLQRRCSREAQEGSRYCWHHRKWHVLEEEPSMQSAAPEESGACASPPKQRGG